MSSREVQIKITDTLQRHCKHPDFFNVIVAKKTNGPRGLSGGSIILFLRSAIVEKCYLRDPNNLLAICGRSFEVLSREPVVKLDASPPKSFAALEL